MRINPNNPNDLELLVEHVRNAKGNSLSFIFGERFNWKTKLLELIYEKLNEETATFKIDYYSKTYLLEYCYFIGIYNILSKAKLFDFFEKKDNQSFQFSSSIIISFFQKLIAKSKIKSKNFNRFRLFFEKSYGGVDKFTLRFALFDLMSDKKKELIFLIDDFEKNISEEIIQEMLSIKNDGLNCHFIIASRPDKRFQRYFTEIDKEYKFNLTYFFLTPINTFHNFKGLNKVSPPWIPGIASQLDSYKNLTEEELYSKIMEFQPYGDISNNSPKTEKEYILLGFTISHGGLRNHDIKSIWKSTEVEQPFIKNDALWKIDSKWNFIDIWREYRYYKDEADKIIEETSLFLTNIIELSLKNPIEVRKLDFINYKMTKNSINHEFSNFVDSHFEIIRNNILKAGSLSSIKKTTNFILNNKKNVSISNLTLITYLFEVTQNLFLLDYGINILIETNNSNAKILDWFLMICLANFKKWHDEILKQAIINLVEKNTTILNKDKYFKYMKETIKPFIVHGHDNELTLGLKNYLQNILHTEEPVILHEQEVRGNTIFENFLEYTENVDVAFVLMTPDDEMKEPRNGTYFRPRQNVVFELGYFIGKLGRDKTIIIVKGNVDIPSDLSGVLVIRTTNNIEEIGSKINREIGAILKERHY